MRKHRDFVISVVVSWIGSGLAILATGAGVL